MPWETPSYVEISMDAEIGGYQDDLPDGPDVVSQNVSPASEHRTVAPVLPAS